VPLPRCGRPTEAAGQVAWLLASEAASANGQVIAIGRGDGC